MTDAPDRHVLFLNWRDRLHPGGGGSEVYIERVAAEMAARGYRATLFCQAHAKAPAQETTPAGVTVIRRGGRHTVYLFAALTYLAGALGFGPLARHRPDLIVDVCNGLPFLSRLYARRPRAGPGGLRPGAPPFGRGGRAAAGRPRLPPLPVRNRVRVDPPGARRP